MNTGAVPLKKLFILFAFAALVLPAVASAHARVSPAVGVAKTLELYTLAVPTEKEGAATTQVEFTPPQGFSIDSFVPSPGWKRRCSRLARATAR